ncbi:Gti1/Pac2 family-domain-containing protein [Halteromyces radiatus]|uniref:Gti1/Pac2 family-domain-containing protein n=1 Tax=Halteromyces radiatus TaxID=101107 RepID=UPI00221E68F8|nr:Gti1/Pac2 family-domain-containing protein [Halteromyces radiatus]KAI8089157.1 Gti1/Pac2 family-domain-containing protein [Halteromyces radiatus]
METFIGYIKTPQDALIIFEACRQGQLNRIQRRLSTKERIHIQSGSIFAWDEKEAGMRRWTDGKTWSPSRVLGSFLTYRELDTKRRPRRNDNTTIKIGNCSYKQDGLVKQSFSICTANNQKLHLISYYSKRDVLNGKLKQPTMDPVLANITIPKGLYPDLNPLDTSGGHTATLHNMRQQQQEEEDDDDDSPPSLSSSPCTSDEDIIMDLLPAYHSHNYYQSSSLLPIQDIAWEKLPSSEDQRQLQAIQGLLKL